MKTNIIVKSLGLAAVMTVSASAFANDWNDSSRYNHDMPHYGAPAPWSAPAVVPAPVVVAAPVAVPAFNMHPAFQESLRLMAEVNDRQERQMDRILDGLYGKRLSSIEFRKLMDEQRAIRTMERHALADGMMNRVEFQRLDAALNVASRNIALESRDRDGRPGFGGGYGGGWNHDSYNHGWNR